MFCEVFCYYTTKDWLKIEDMLKNFDEKITIITTNEELKFFIINEKLDYKFWLFKGKCGTHLSVSSV